MTKKATEKAIPSVSVLDRRLKNPFGSPSIPITLKSKEHFEIRIVDAQLRPGRLHEMRANKGWEFVHPDELDGTADEYGLRVMDGRLVRGENGREVLMKMPSDMYAQIVARKTAINAKGVSGKALKEAAAQETAKAFGDEAGETVFSRNIDVQTTRGDDAELEETA